MSGPFETEAEAAAAARTLGGPPEPGWSILSPEQRRQMLAKACEAAGVELGTHDTRVLAWLSGWEDGICAVVAGLVTRAAAKGEPAPPARVTGIYPGGATSPDHVRVAVRCSCGELNDLTYKASLPPGTLDCAGCGERLELPGDLEPLTPEQAWRAEWRRSLRGPADGRMPP